MKTNEISTRVSTITDAKRPIIVHHLTKYCKPSIDTPGLEAIHIKESDTLEALIYEIENDRRRHPIVILRADEDGIFPSDVQKLTGFVKTLASVILVNGNIPEMVVRRILGKYYLSPGTIGIIHAYTKRNSSGSPRIQKIQLEEIEKWKENNSIEKEILSYVTHLTNLPMSWGHAGVTEIEEENKRRLFRNLVNNHNKAKSKVETLEFLEGYIGQLEHEIEILKKQKHEAEEISLATDVANSSLNDEVRHLKYRNQTLQDILDNSNHYTDLSNGDIPEEISKALVTSLEGEPRPVDALLVIQSLFKERIVILPSAFKSAEESECFRNKGQLFNILFKLATDYWEALSNGKSDAEAKDCFGKVYAAGESESTEKRQKAREQRTFIYNNEPIVMMKHLRLGWKESTADTIRVHFEWIAKENIIVVGYCGPHLDHK
jgi:hypothetical protein